MEFWFLQRQRRRLSSSAEMAAVEPVPEGTVAGGDADLHPGAPPGGLHTHGGPPRPPRWAIAEDVSSRPDEAILTPAQVKQFREQRYLVLDGVYPEDLVQQGIACHTAHFPAPAADGSDTAELAEGHSGFGGIGTDREFPFDEEHNVFNTMTLHPRALSAAAQLLDTPVLRISRSNFGGKYGAHGHDNPRQSFDGGWPTGDQNIHVSSANRLHRCQWHSDHRKKP